MSSGGSFGANPLWIEQGLGNCTNISKVEIIWAGSNNTQYVQDLDINTYVIIKEGDDVPNIKALTHVKLKPVDHQHHHH